MKQQGPTWMEIPPRWGFTIVLCAIITDDAFFLLGIRYQILQNLGVGIDDVVRSLRI